MRSFRVLVLGLAGAASLSACATKGYVNRKVDQFVGYERVERQNADSAQGRDIATLRTDLTSLRNDLQTLRNEFGARITAMEDQVKFTMPVHFAFDDASVRQEDQAALQRFAQVANKYYNGAAITVEGFADPAGSTRYNAQLSKRRADSVKDFLVAQGLNDGLLKTVGMGESRQVRPGAAGTDAGAELNRRVVFVIESPGVGAATTAATTASMQ
ncbi:MAG: OmpA family protein [Gemmatirosa sp.]